MYSDCLTAHYNSDLAGLTSPPQRHPYPFFAKKETHHPKRYSFIREKVLFAI